MCLSVWSNAGKYPYYIPFAVFPLIVKVGENVVNPRLQDWYVQLQKEKIGVSGLGEMMAGRLTPAEAIKKIQGFADEAAKDDSIKHYKHQ